MSHEDLENEQHDVTTGFQIQTGFGERVLQGTTTFGLTDKETVRESTTRSTISKGQLEITEESKEEINRNIELIEEIRRDEIISDTDFSITVDNRLFSGDGLRDIGRSIVNLPRNLGTMTRNVVSNPLTNEITSYINSPRNEELIILQSDTLLASNTNMPLPRVTDIETINQVRQLFEAAGIALLAGDTILVPAIAAVGGTYMLYRGGRLVANVVRKRKKVKQQQRAIGYSNQTTTASPNPLPPRRGDEDREEKKKTNILRG